MATVREAPLYLLRALRTMVFGDPGSTELPYIKDFPDDSRPEEGAVHKPTHRERPPGLRVRKAQVQLARRARLALILGPKATDKMI